MEMIQMQKRSRLYQFVIPLMISILDFAFIIDFLCYVATGDSLAAALFGGSSFSASVADALPADPFWLLACSGAVLAFLAVVMYAMIWIAFYDYRGRKMEAAYLFSRGRSP
jgi:hypothetical protein